MTLLDLPYQEEGANFLASRKTALLADEPRLGKSIQTIMAADKARALKVLVVCPAGVCENWRRDIHKYRNGDWSAAVVSFEMACGSAYRRLLADEYDILVIDEGHYIKNLEAKRTTALYGKKAECGPDALASRAAQVWVLTGTPMPNHAGELFPHLRALYPSAITSTRTGLPWTYFQFTAAYCLKRSNGFGETIVGSKNEERLHAVLKDFMLRRRRKDVLSHIPPTQFEDLWIEGDVGDLPGDEIAIVRAVLAEHGIAGLKRIAANGSVATLRRLVGMAKVPAMQVWLKEWLQNNPPEDKIVVFAHHHDVIEALFDKLHTSFVRVNKFTKPAERQKFIDRFKSDPTVRGIIVRMSAEGVGISLASADEMIVLEPSWVPGTNDQVFERIVDLGKARPNTVRFPKIAGSIDEDIQTAVARKMSSIAKVVDGVS